VGPGGLALVEGAELEVAEVVRPVVDMLQARPRALVELVLIQALRVACM
jgi:hypothetical protein